MGRQISIYVGDVWFWNVIPQGKYPYMLVMCGSGTSFHKVIYACTFDYGIRKGLGSMGRRGKKGTKRGKGKGESRGRRVKSRGKGEKERREEGRPRRSGKKGERDRKMGKEMEESRGRREEGGIRERKIG